MSTGWFFFYALALYVAAGLGVAAAFVTFGATRALAHPAPVSLGARVLLFPAAAAFWPLILSRWLRKGAKP
jgi:hypothetical protein